MSVFIIDTAFTDSVTNIFYTESMYIIKRTV